MAKPHPVLRVVPRMTLQSQQPEQGGDASGHNAGAPHSSSRYALIDALRGFALVWMTVFHFCFDLMRFGYLKADFYHDPFWLVQRSAIVSLFLLCAGMGQAVAWAQGQSWQRFGRRWGQVAACALLVSLSTYWLDPRSYIYFGVLHGMALMLLLTRLAAVWGLTRPQTLWWLGAGILALYNALPWLHTQWPILEFLNTKPWDWLGLISRKPVTQDHVPLVPWLGVMCWGVALGHWLQDRHGRCLRRPLPVALRSLALLGRWSLSYYMLHQLVLMGGLTWWAWLLR